MYVKRNLGLFYLLIFVLLFFSFNSCVKESLEDTGTIKYVNLEGGFYGIVADDGEEFYPVNLKNEFKQDGLKVKFVYSVNKNTAGIHQWGKIIEILTIRKI